MKAYEKPGFIVELFECTTTSAVCSCSESVYSVVKATCYFDADNGSTELHTVYTSSMSDCTYYISSSSSLSYYSAGDTYTLDTVTGAEYEFPYTGYYLIWTGSDGLTHFGYITSEDFVTGYNYSS